MHIGIVSHVSTAQLSSYLYLEGDEPVGTEGATAPNLLIIELLKNGHRVSVFSLTKDLLGNEEYVVNGEYLTIHFGAYQQNIRKSGLSMFYKERQFLKNKILEINPDVLHAHWQYEYAWGALDTGIKTIVTCRDSPVKVLMLFKNIYRLIRLIMAFIVLKKAKIITATSPYLADELRKFGVKKNIELIPNFEPDWLFEKIIQTKNLNKPMIIMINNGFDNRKNVGNGILAFQLFRKNYPLAELHLYGNGFDEKGEGHAWAQKNSCDENVFFRGYKDFVGLMNDLSKFTMLVHPSKEETFGNIITESMALGVPVIGGSQSGSIPWVIGKEQTGGILVDINNPLDICSAMMKIISSKRDYEEYVNNARSHAFNNFSAQKVVRHYSSLYNNA